MMSDQNFDNKDKVEILPNGVKVIWQFYKPKKEKASDPQSSDKSQEDSKDSYGNRTSAGKRTGTKSSSRSGYSARGRAGASASAGGKSSYKSKSTAYKSKKSTQEPTAYSGFAKENHHYDNETKFNHSQFNAAANQSGNDFYANNRAVSKQSRTSQNSYSRANQPPTNNDYMANNYQGYGQGSVRPAQAQATAPAIATASARASTPNSLLVIVLVAERALVLVLGVKAAIKVKVLLISLKRAHRSLQLIQVLLKKTTTMIMRLNSIIANLMLRLTSLVMTFMPIIEP